VSRLKETDSESEVPSLDAATADHAGTFGDRLSGDADVYEEVLRGFEGEELRAALTELPDRSRQVVTLHFGLRGGRPLTFREIGRRLGVSGQRAAQIEQQTLEELSARLDASVAH